MNVFYINPADGSVAATISVDESQAAMYPGTAYVQAPPPDCPGGQAPAWVDGAWACLSDLRGTVWHAPGTNTYVTITALGQQPPEGWEPGFPPPPEDENTVNL